MLSPSRILVVEDDLDVLNLLKDTFEIEGFFVSGARDADEMHRRMSESAYDLITLDLGLPGKSGLDIARELRRNSDTPIVVVSARGTDIDRIVGLEIGADDYIAKPFNLREVVARVRSVLRRSAGSSQGQNLDENGKQSVHVFQDYKLNTLTRKLQKGKGSAVVLTAAECSLLEFLLKNAGRVCSRDELTSKLKGHEWSPFDRTLDTLVARLRRKIEPERDESSIIMSVRGIGYVLAVGEAKD
jgi:two-component system, OmpR family, response regulator